MHPLFISPFHLEFKRVSVIPLFSSHASANVTEWAYEKEITLKLFEEQHDLHSAAKQFGFRRKESSLG